MEYERLEQELEDLNSKMDALRISGQDQAIRKQQLEGQINVLNEQILAGHRMKSIIRDVSRLLRLNFQ